LAHLVTASGNPEPQRIGLSATQRPLSEVARYLGGDRPVEIIDASSAPALDLAIVVPPVDMAQPALLAPAADSSPAADAAARTDTGAPPSSAPPRDNRPRSDGGGMWPHIYPRLLDEILA